MKLKALLILSLFLVGCAQIEIAKEKASGLFAPKEYKVINTTKVNATNTTKNLTVTKSVVNVSKLTYFISSDSVVVMDKDTAIVIDSSGYSAQQLLTNYNRNPDIVVSTLHLEKNSVIKNLVISHPPKVIYDNGINTLARQGYVKFADTLHYRVETIKSDQSILVGDLPVSFYVPFKAGLYDEANLNSIAVKVGDLLYMSNCYKGCQEHLETPKAKYLVLANNGKCPTNDLEFVQMTRAMDIYGVELCADFLKDAWLEDTDQLKAIGIEFHQITGTIGVNG